MNATRDLPLDEATPGMTLAAPILDAGGNVLLPAALTLTESHLDSLRRRGIATLSVEVATDSVDLARQRERIRARVMHIFRHSADAPEAQALLHAVLAFRQEQLK